MIKKFEGILILNWKTGAIKAQKRKNLKRLLPHEIPIKLDIDVEIPELKETTLTGKITVPETKIQEMVLEEL